MTHLKIELNNIQENVSSIVIDKLYELVSSGDLDLTSNLLGNLHTTGTYQYAINGIREVFPDLYISADNIYAYFEDPEVRRIIALYIGDGNGTLSSLVSSYSGNLYKKVGSSNITFFKDNTSIRTFNELDLFVNITEFYEKAFYGCTNLESITLPPNLLNIRQLCFYNCSSLNIDLVLPSAVTEIGLEAFKGSAIKSITFPLSGFLGASYYSNNVHYLDLDTASELTNIYNVPSVSAINFTGCSKLLQITLPDSVHTIRCNLCTSLRTVICGQNSHLSEFATVAAFGNGGTDQSGFPGCSLLQTIENFPKDNFTKIPTLSFNNCSSLDDINKYIGHSVVSIGLSAFSGAGHSSGSYIHIPASVTSIGNTAFFGFGTSKCPGFIFHSTSAPTIGTNCFGESYSYRENYTTNLYVPYSSVSDYKAVSGLANLPSNKTWKYSNKVYGYKIYLYSSSAWNELTNPTEALIESASSNVVNSVPSSSATEGDLAFVVFNS